MYLQIIWFELLAFVCSLIALPVIWKSKYLRIFPFLMLIIVAVEGFYKFFITDRWTNNAPVYNVQVPLQYVCYLLMLYYSARNVNFKRFLIVGLIILVAFNAITTIYFTPEHYSNVWGYCCCSIIAIIGIIAKFYEMVITTRTSKYDFLKDPFFYMLFAFLFYNLVTLPYFGMANWLYYTNKFNEYNGIYRAFTKVMSVTNYILYTTYSIAFIWIARTKVIY